MIDKKMCKWKEPMHLDIDRLRDKKLKDICAMKITHSKVPKKKKKGKKEKKAVFISILNAFCSFYLVC